MGSGEGDAGWAEHIRELTRWVIDNYGPALDALAADDGPPPEDDPNEPHEAPTL